jgi:hypothetical protein
LKELFFSLCTNSFQAVFWLSGDKGLKVLLKEGFMLGVEAHAYNPSYSGGRARRIRVEANREKRLTRSHLNKYIKNGGCQGRGEDR